MKQFLPTLITCLLLCFSLSLVAQNDTIIWEDFQVDPTDMMSDFPNGDDTTWVNLDLDGIPPGNSTVTEGDFYLAIDFGYPDTIIGDTNLVFASCSWLANFDPGSSNWLILPPVDVNSANFTFHWKSAPLQGPRYMDGYTVKLSPGSNDPTDNEYVVLFEAAEMTNILGGGTSVDSFEFSQGYIHADSYTDTTYFLPAGTPGAFDDANVGILEPHSVSLAAYEGQTVYIAIHHDSSDDNICSWDDILVLGDFAVGVNDPLAEDVRFVTYPNPTTNYVNVMYRLEERTDVSLAIFDMQGKQVYFQDTADEIGDYTFRVDMRSFVAGQYNIVLNINGQQVTKPLIKN